MTLPTIPAVLSVSWVLVSSVYVAGGLGEGLAVALIPLALSAAAVAKSRGKTSLILRGLAALLLYFWAFFTFVWTFTIGAHLMMLSTVLSAFALSRGQRSDDRSYPETDPTDADAETRPS